jgi:hypothetical protein
VAELVAPIGTREIAEKYGCHMVTAWRILRRIHDQHGDKTVMQSGGRGRGKRLYTSLKALHDAEPHRVQLKELEREEIEAVIAKRFRDRTATLEKKNAELTVVVNALNLQIKELLASIDSLTTGLQNVTEYCARDSVSMRAPTGRE